MRGVVAVIMLCIAQLLSAQIRIIPQTKLLEAEPKSVEGSPLRFATEEVSFGTIDEMSGVWQPVQPSRLPKSIRKKIYFS